MRFVIIARPAPSFEAEPGGPSPTQPWLLSTTARR
jgi:hypothetical protein